MSSYNAANGDLDWSATIPTQYLFSSSPTAANGIVYTDGAGRADLYAYSQSTGALLWTQAVTNGDESSPAVNADDVYVSFACDLTQAFDAISGAPYWTYENGCEGGAGRPRFWPTMICSCATRSSMHRPARRSAATPPGRRRPSTRRTPTSRTAGPYGPRRSPTGRSWSAAGDGGFDTSPIEVNGVVYEGSTSGTLFALFRRPPAKSSGTTTSAPRSTPMSTWRVSTTPHGSQRGRRPAGRPGR